MTVSGSGRLLHGADYYPEQWLDRPEILEEDIRLMKKAHINVVTLGVFAWSALEPEEGKYDFSWLDERVDRLWENGISVIMATPSGARPAWAAAAYPEVLRVAEDRRRNLYGMRMNHCYTSPKYRELVQRMDRALGRRYGGHPALAAWHISNEYHGECHCPLCQEAFRNFLREKYTALDKLNQAWWTAFWSKTYTDWEQIVSPSSVGERALQGLALDWKRFVTKQTREFMNLEIAAVREGSPDVPVTTNMIGTLIEVDYPRLAQDLDVAALDTYPEWGKGPDAETALGAGMEYDVTRTLKKAPFLLMETTPSMTNWTEAAKPKPPGMHAAGCLQAIAHGADSIQYFQWRKSRGGFEKFHGAVIGHSGHEHTRVFRETEELGALLKRAEEIAGAENPCKTAILYDWENRWAVEGSIGPRKEKGYEETVREHYAGLRRWGVNVDFIDEEQPLDGYQLLAAPMLYLLKAGMDEKLEQFVNRGGILVLTSLSGITDENDLCFQGGFPGPLRRLAGIWEEELDVLYPEEVNEICCLSGNSLGLSGKWPCARYCGQIRPEKAATEAVYGKSWYAGAPALTRNNWGKGTVWYLAAGAGRDFLTGLYGSLLKQSDLACRTEPLPVGVELSVRRKGEVTYWFYSNFSGKKIELEAPFGHALFRDRPSEGMLLLAPLETEIIRCGK